MSQKRVFIKAENQYLIDGSFALNYPDFNLKVPKKDQGKINNEVKVSINGTLLITPVERLKEG